MHRARLCDARRADHGSSHLPCCHIPNSARGTGWPFAYRAPRRATLSCGAHRFSSRCPAPIRTRGRTRKRAAFQSGRSVPVHVIAIIVIPVTWARATGCILARAAAPIVHHAQAAVRVTRRFLPALGAHRLRLLVLGHGFPRLPSWRANSIHTGSSRCSRWHSASATERRHHAHTRKEPNLSRMRDGDSQSSHGGCSVTAYPPLRSRGLAAQAQRVP